MKLRKILRYEEFQKFFDYLTILQDKKKLEEEILYLLDCWYESRGINKFGLPLNSRFDLFLLINRLIYYCKFNFNSRIPEFFCKDYRDKFKGNLRLMIRNLNDNFRIVRYNYLRYKGFLKNLLRSFK